MCGHQSKKGRKVSGVISSAVAYIKQNCKRDISLGEVAESVNLNPSYLSRLFKEEKGIQFVEYVRNIKNGDGKGNAEKQQ